MLKFGEYLREKRLAKGITLRKFAEITKKSPSSISEMENGIRIAPSDELLMQMAELLELSNDEANMMYDLAAKTKVKNTIPADITEIVKNSNTVRVALRVARSLDATEEEWEDFMRRLQEKREKGEI